MVFLLCGKGHQEAPPALGTPNGADHPGHWRSQVTIEVSTSDPRSVKALAILADSGQWLKLRTRDGRKFYGVRSQASPETVYSVDCHGCDCPDFLKRLEFGRASSPCKHVLAVQ